MMYIWTENGPLLMEDSFEWAKWMQRDGNRIIDVTRYPDDVRVSTVFLGIDHGFLDGGQPVLFETMIFGGTHDMYQTRGCTPEEALDMHRVACALIQGELDESRT